MAIAALVYLTQLATATVAKGGCVAMTKYKCWDPEYCDFESAREYDTYSAEAAAHHYAENVCDDDNECYSGYESGVDVKVVSQETGVEVTVRVWMEMQPQFRTMLKR